MAARWLAAATGTARDQMEENFAVTSATAGSNATATHAQADSANDVSFYVYIFLGVIAGLAAVSIAGYCIHQRRMHRFAQRDNTNNNMQRHSLIDSYVEAGEVEWQCSICYHENHPAKRECLLCGTPEVISQQAVASPASAACEKKQASFASVIADPKALQLAARNRSFHVRRLNEMNLNQRQRGARRRHLWQREKAHDGQFRWVRMEDCRPSRISILASDLPYALTSGRDASHEVDDAYVFGAATDPQARSRHDMSYNGTIGGIETELAMYPVENESGESYAPTIRRNVNEAGPSDASPNVIAPDTDVSTDDVSAFISQPSVGYVRHVDAHGNVEWVPAESVIHEDVEAIDVGEYPRASSVIDFESVAALPFRQKVRWFLMEIDKVSIPWEEGHLLLKIRREAMLNESMHLLMLVPASDLRQRLRIEFIDEPGLDAGGLLREWVLLLCEKLFDESFGLFQPTHVENLGYWINPNSEQIHRDHLKCYQFVGRLMAKCLLEGQLLTVHFSLPLLKHILGVPISFSDLEFLDEELYRNATWLRDNDNVDNLSLDFTIQHMDGNDEMVTTELKPGGKDILVTDDNKEEYLDLLMKHKMFASVKEQLSALLQGLFDVIPRTLLAVFDYQELELLLCGVPNIDVDDWQTHTDVKFQDLDHPSKQERKVVEWFWETVRRFSQEERARLLQFVTGTSRVPVEGFKALVSNDGRVRRFGIHLVQCGVPPTGLYPKSHTCFNRIDLPVYHTKDQLETYLTLVINMEITGFSMQ